MLENVSMFGESFCLGTHAMSVDDGGARWKWKVEWRYVNESTVNELLTPN